MAMALALPAYLVDGALCGERGIMNIIPSETDAELYRAANRVLMMDIETHWFRRKRSGRWFLEDDPSWERYRVPEGQRGEGKIYWWNGKTEECFWEDSGNTSLYLP